MRLPTALAAAAALLCTASLADAKPLKKPSKPAPRHRVVRHDAPRGVAISMDEVRVVSFTQPITTVFVGNPSIADATVIDPHHAFVLGKSFGVTNLIALGPNSQTVSNQQVMVANRAGGVVTLNKGAQQYNYSCSMAHCESNPVPGDQKAFFDDNAASIGVHQDQALKAASVAAAH
jgi:hypothetical protein